MIMFFFFKQKTAYEMRISDWSSDVCSSDLRLRRRNAPGICDRQPRRPDARLPRRRPRADRRQGQQPKMESANGRGGDRRLDRRDLRAIARNGTMDPAHLTLPPTLRPPGLDPGGRKRSEETTSELQSLMPNTY